MLSYIHAYHAGNFADVLKHVVLIQVLSYLTQKEKPILYLETHAGSGVYTLSDQNKVPTREYTTGIARLWPMLKQGTLSGDPGKGASIPDELTTYLNTVGIFNGSDALTHYPGSPAIAQHLLRAQDQLLLAELHPKAFQQLCAQAKQGFALPGASESKLAVSQAKCHVFKRDGFAHLKASLPPRKGRACVLIDPSYERKEEYQSVVSALVDAHRRFPTGVYLLWYPVLSRVRVRALEHALKNSGMRRITLFELCISKDSKDRGMTGSGMIVINGPWTLPAQMEPNLAFLHDQLSKPEGGSFRVKTLVGE